MVYNESEQPGHSEELNLDQMWVVQAHGFLRLGFDRELGYASPEAYLNSLPRFSPQQERFKNRFDTPILVEPRIPLRRLLELSGIEYMITDQQGGVRDWVENNFTVPNDSYTVWLGVKGEDAAKSTIEVRKNLKSDERGATVHEGVYFYLNDPGVVTWKGYPRNMYSEDVGHYLIMLGSQAMDGGSRSIETELRLYIGLYVGAVSLVDNGDSAEDPFTYANKKLIAAREI